MAFIWGGCCVAWIILGSTLGMRTGSSSAEEESEVNALWGPALAQRPPRAEFLQPTSTLTSDTAPTAATRGAVPLSGSSLQADLTLEQRQKGLLWFPTYTLQFKGAYTFENDTDADRDVTFSFPLAAANGMDGFSVHDEAGKPVRWSVVGSEAQWRHRMKAGQSLRYDLAFRSRGTRSWTYAPADAGEARQLDLVVNTNFGAADFPPGSLSPTSHQRTPSGWRGEWHFESLISSAPVGLVLPQKLNPGPLAARITFFAPVSLLFFFFVVTVLAQHRDQELHPAHYFFLGCSFFSFHLLFAYMADHLALRWVFLICSLVSLSLSVSYVRLFAGWRFALREVGVAQLIYLVLFSMTFFLEGFTGLAVACISVATLFVMMQVTGGRNLSAWTASQSTPAAIKSASPLPGSLLDRGS